MYTHRYIHYYVYTHAYIHILAFIWEMIEGGSKIRFYESKDQVLVPLEIWVHTIVVHVSDALI